MGGWAYPRLWGCKYQWEESRRTERSMLYCDVYHIPTSRVVGPTVTSLRLQKLPGVTCSDSQGGTWLGHIHNVSPEYHLFSFPVFCLLFSYLIVYAFSLMELWFSWLSLNPLQCYSKPMAKKATERKTLNNLMLVYICDW